jgi:glutamate/tyrosine decarboxylase-like PLP-dependent enzyme
MENLPNTSVLLFSYGTLQDKAVQLANFGRERSLQSTILKSSQPAVRRTIQWFNLVRILRMKFAAPSLK